MQLPRHREGWFLFVFAVQFLVGVPLAIIFERDGNSIVELIAAVAVASVATTTLIVDGGAMLAERYLNRRFEEGEIKGKLEALEAARSWFARQQEALAKGEKFTEPPPWEKPQ